MENKNNKKTSIINLRVTEEQKKELARVTKELNTSRSKLLVNYVDTLIHIYQ